MKKIFPILLAGALLAGTATVAFAQAAGPKSGQKPPQGGQAGPGGQRGGFGARLAEQIKPPLTDAQKKKIEAINNDFREQMRKLRPAGGPGGRSGATPPKGGTAGEPPAAGQRQGFQMDEKTRQKFMELNKKRMDAIKKVLTKEQLASFAKLEKQMRDRMPNRQGGPGGGRQGAPPPKGGKGG